ncbi:hypothetical protein M2152_000167 [Microbacteriaceae bacterium SG_E_30_P1]|uniref:Uncharacterized protein n=1 Tax=Antiquaquibacter oligotrophicus TaxID=2880260 RepID=A0ABT6KJ39_9MICO|nr:hypothetical protein [Antiquaquibacter oligotrophicus]MDH6179985.1 hypothetical protein [Antiquaquibacter oligotrophicus]UDF14259.1 hypothetical protein LH407_05195 [Antiquaquibacter oligotrophicus]
MIARAAAAAASALLLLGAITACAAPVTPADRDIDPLPVEPDGGIGTTSPCDELWPDQPFGNDPASISILPTGWPSDPPGGIRCSAAMTTETTAIIQYVTDAPAEEVAAYYERNLSSFDPVVSDGIGGYPVVNGTDGTVEFGIQTDDEYGSIVIGIALLE